LNLLASWTARESASTSSSDMRADSSG
jgi:hypothetical protein